MYFLGHLGIGRQLAAPFSRGLPVKILLLGTVLPDLVDKPLYYGLSYLTGLRGVDLGLISGTQTFGHTGLFLLVTVCIAWLLKSKTLAALSLGWVTHLLLDGVTELALASATSQPQFIRALLFPFLGWGFPVMPYSGFQAHLLGGLKAKLLFAEVIGALLLARYLIRSRGRGTILE